MDKQITAMATTQVGADHSADEMSIDGHVVLISAMTNSLQIATILISGKKSAKEKTCP